MAKKVKAGNLVVDVSLGLAGLFQDVKTLNKTIDGSFRSIKKLASGVAGIFGTAAVLYSIKKFSDSIKNLAKAGDTASDIEQSFKALGGSSAAIDQAKQATMGLVGSFDLMRAANLGLLANLPDLNTNFSKIAELATRWGQAMKKEPVEAMDTLVRAMMSGRERGLAQFGIFVDKSMSLAQKQKSAMEQLGRAIESLAPITLGAGDAFKVLEVAQTAAHTKMGQGIDDNTQLKNAILSLAKTMDATNWKAFGQGVGDVGRALADLATTVLPYVVSLVENLGRGLHYAFGTDAVAKAAYLAKEIERVKETLARGEAVKSKSWVENMADTLSIAETGTPISPNDSSSQVELQNKLIELQKQYDEQINIARKDQQSAAKEWADRMEEQRKKQNKLFDERLAKGDKAAAKEQKALEKLTTEYDKFIANVKAKSLEDAMSKALSEGDIEAFTRLEEEFLQATREGITAGYAESLASTNPLIREQAQKNIDAQVDAARGEKGQQLQDVLTERQKAAYEEGIEFWESSFENAITGVTFSLSDALSQVAVGFAAEIANSLAGGVTGGLSSLKDVGRVIAQQIFGMGSGSTLSQSGLNTSIGGVTSNFGSFLSGFFGSGNVGPVASGEEYGAMLSGGSLAGAAGAFGLMNTVSALSGIGQSTEETGAAIGSAAGAALGSMAGPIGIAIGSYAGEYIGEAVSGIFSSETTNAETKARRAFDKWLSDKLTASSSKFDFSLGDSTRFNQGGWGESFMGSKTGQQFNALGTALVQLSGVTEDVGGQIGAILQEDLNGNLDNARLMLKELNISAEDLSAAFMDMAESGQITWQEWAVEMQQIGDLTAEGLVAVGNLQGAYDQLSQSGGRGMDAIYAIQNMAIEASELQIDTIEELGTALVEQGMMSQDQWEEFYNILQTHGIDTMEELKSASTDVLGGIIADLDSNVELFEEWKQQVEDATQRVEDLAMAWEDVPEEWKTDYIINVERVGDEVPEGIETPGEESPKNPKSQVGKVKTRFLSRRSLSYSGNEFASAVSAAIAEQASTMRTLSKVAPVSVSYNIDARGATPGVEARILTAMQTVGKKAAAAAVREMRARGGL